MSVGLTSSIKGASPEVVQAIQSASRKTGVDFSYLVNQARTESSFRPDVKAQTSSATGLYQFIDQTWLSTVKQYGAKHGLGDVASKIEKDFQGRYFVANDTDRDMVLNLRKNPKVASLMAAEFASSNQQIIEQKTGRDATQTDLYLAHFLGAGGASKFLTAMQDDPNGSAAPLLKSAAKANKNIFYNSDGSMKSLNQVYKKFESKFEQIHEGQGVDIAEAQITVDQNKSYRPDPEFSRFYSRPVTDFVQSLPSLSSLKTNDFFSSLLSVQEKYSGQNQFIDPMSFFMLTQLDVPR